MSKPIVDLSDCILCEVCIDVCPEVFRLNAAGFIEVLDLDVFPTEGVAEAIRNCPVDCISWDPT